MSQSYSIRLMEEKDTPRSVILTDLMRWGFDMDDFTFMLKLEPGGCFVAVKDDQVIGLIISISFGSVGWVGNIIVSPQDRMKGIGAALVSEALKHLRVEGVTAVGLYAYKNVVPFYESLGFRTDRDFSWMVCREVSWTGESMPTMDNGDFQAVLGLDELCFGASRKRLLEAIFGSPKGVCRVSLGEGKLVAYLMAVRASESVEIGPWVCERGNEKEGFRLFRSLGDQLRGLEAHVGVPSDRTDVIDFLSDLGFIEDFPVVRMFYGAIPSARDCVLAMESLERG
jgi:GNAT superfamily N-acetyltransferase